MVEPIVLDASAALAILRAEPSAGPVRQIIRDHLEADGALIVPDHFWLEVVNVLVRRHGHDVTDAVEAVRDLDEIGVASIEIDRPLLLLTLGWIAAADLTAYDAAYLALAESADARLLTLDGRLGAAAGARSVLRVPADSRPVSPRRTSEVGAAYGRSAGGGGPPGFGPYLAALREKASAGTR